MIWQPLDATFEDGLALLVPYLRDVVAPVRVSVSLRGWQRPDPVVQVHRFGGPVRGVNDEADIQVDVRHATYDEVTALTEDVRHALRLAPVAGLCRAMRERTGPDRTTDEDGGQRVRLTWVMVVGPKVGV